MFAAVADALVERLQAEQAAGRMLEAVRLVRKGDHQPITDKQHPALTVDWDGQVEFVFEPAQMTLAATFLVALYTVSMAGADAAERELQGLVWTDSAGGPTGLLPAICRVARRSIEIDGRSYLLQVAKTVDTGAVKGKDGSHATGFAVVAIRVTTMRRPPT